MGRSINLALLRTVRILLCRQARPVVYLLTTTRSRPSQEEWLGSWCVGRDIACFLTTHKAFNEGSIKQGSVPRIPSSRPWAGGCFPGGSLIDADYLCVPDRGAVLTSRSAGLLVATSLSRLGGLVPTDGVDAHAQIPRRLDECRGGEIMNSPCYFSPTCSSK